MSRRTHRSTVARQFQAGGQTLMAMLCLAAGVFLIPGAFAAADPASPSPARRSSAFDEIRRLIQASRFTEAEDRARALLSENETSYGPASLETAGALDLLVEAMWRGGRGHQPEARELAERAIAIKERVGGVEDREVLASRRNLAYVLSRAGDRSRARALFEQLVTSREKLTGSTQPEVAVALIDLANLLLTDGDYAAALGIYERALDLQNRTLGADHPDVSRTLHNLALANHWLGDLETARRLFERSLSIKEKAFGVDQLEVAWTLNALAVVLEEEGDYVGARSGYERALSIREANLGPDHLQVASTLNNLGYLLRTIGDYGEALDLFQRTLGIEERILGAEDPDVATARYNLAEVFRLTGAMEQALSLHEQALRTREKILQPNHPALALSQFALGEVLLTRGDLEASRARHAKAVDIWRTALGEEHFQYGVGLSGLANVVARTDEWRESIAYFERAISIKEKARGPDHPDLARDCVHLGEVLARADEIERALACFLRAEEIGRGHLRLAVTALSEREALRYAAVRPSGLDPALSLVASGRLQHPPTEVFDMVIRSRMLVLDEIASRRHLVAERVGERAPALLEALTRASRRLASLKTRGPEGLVADQYLQSVNLARKEKELAERGLAQASAEFRRNLMKLQADVRGVTAALPPRSALVGYVLYRASETSGSTRSGYVAMLLRHGAKEPRFMSLGQAPIIDGLVEAWRRSIAGSTTANRIRSGEAESAARAAGEALRRHVWDPLSPILRGTERVFVVPDGSINLVDLSALPTGESGYLLDEDPLIHYLSSERDLMQQPSHGGRGRGLLAMGAPDFDATRAGGGLPSASRTRGESSEGSEWSRSLSLGCKDWQSIRFAALPAAGREIEEVAILWSLAATRRPGPRSVRPSPASGDTPEVIRLSGTEATEVAFKRNAAGRRTLHLATHGFFLDPHCREAPPPRSRGVGALSLAARLDPAVPGIESPLMLSGLALAGANNRHEAGVDEEDGILTGEEIITMDLSGVEWAVLSACDTGLGKVMAGEGVLGLRRAFQIAGVATVITSLWPVDDSVAREWMGELYRARFATGKATAEAIREASRRLLHRRRSGSESTHPIYWAGFLASGDWR